MASVAGAAARDFFGGVVYINLERRKDRREQIEAELARLGISGERFEAIDRQPGIVGCGYSHLEVLKLARQRGWRNVLILEDDFEALGTAEEFWGPVTEFFRRGEPFDVLMLAYYAEGWVPVDDLLIKILNGQTASAYVVDSGFYDQIIDLYSWAIPELERTGRHWEFANDQVWKRLQPAARWLAFRQRLGRQRASYSDNTQSFMDYGI